MQSSQLNKKHISETSPAIHYVWIGPPTHDDPSSIAGHDIAGPIEMAKAIQKQNEDGIPTTNNPIKFWCFREFKESYEERFRQEHVPIEVCAIEDLIEEEKESKELGEHAKFIENLKKNIKKNDIEHRLKFKDGFSLFLLASRGGYFMDTNIFPDAGKMICLPQFDTFTTAMSGFTGDNDFYMMFSPHREHNNTLNVLEVWEKKSQGERYLGKGMRPSVSDKKIPFFYDQKPFEFEDEKLLPKKMGVIKLSYKSYFGHMNQKPSGLFFWVDQPSHADFESRLRYGDVNLQTPCERSRKILEQCSLCYDKDPEKNWRSINFETDKAFIFDGKSIYYVDKQAGTCIKIFQGKNASFDLGFPHPLTDINHVLGTPTKLLDIIDHIGVDKKSLKLITNIENCTILHHAVLRGDLKKVESILNAGADINLKALYRITEYSKSPEELNLTAKELAKQLKNVELEQLIQSHELKVKTEEDIEAVTHALKAQPKEETIINALVRGITEEKRRADFKVMSVADILRCRVEQLNNGFDSEPEEKMPSVSTSNIQDSSDSELSSDERNEREEVKQAEEISNQPSSLIDHYYALSASADNAVKNVAQRRSQILTDNKPNADWKEFEKLWNDSNNHCFKKKVEMIFRYYDRQSPLTLFASNIVCKLGGNVRQFSGLANRIAVLLTLEQTRNWKEEDILNFFATDKEITKATQTANPDGRMMAMIKFVEAKCMGVDTQLNLKKSASNTNKQIKGKL